jgi:hypothetical protein
MSSGDREENISPEEVAEKVKDIAKIITLQGHKESERIANNS